MHMLQGAGGCRGLARSGEMPAQKLAIGLLQILELLLVLFANVERIGAQGVLHPALGILDPALNLRG